MTGAGILDGDLIVVDRAEDPRNGSIVVAVLPGDGFTVKRLVHQRSGGAQLRAEHPDFPRTPLGPEVEIWGVVVGVVRSLR